MEGQHGVVGSNLNGLSRKHGRFVQVVGCLKGAIRMSCLTMGFVCNSIMFLESLGVSIETALKHGVAVTLAIVFEIAVSLSSCVASSFGNLNSSIKISLCLWLDFNLSIQ